MNNFITDDDSISLNSVDVVVSNESNAVSLRYLTNFYFPRPKRNVFVRFTKQIQNLFTRIKTYFKIREVARKVLERGFKRTISGNYHVEFEEAAEMGKVDLDFIVSHKREIADIIDRDKRILSETWIDEDFDMNFCWEEYSNE